MTPMNLTAVDVHDAIDLAAEKVGFTKPVATVDVTGNMVTISFDACRVTVGRQISGLHDLTNLARIAVIRAIHSLEPA